MTDEEISRNFKLQAVGDAGRAAYKSGHSRRDNPFVLQSSDFDFHKQWDLSFCQALKDDAPRRSPES